MDYKQSNTVAVDLTATVDNFNYKISYNYDSKGNITGIRADISKTVDNVVTQIGNMSVNNSNGYVDMNIAGTEDLTVHATNITTLLAKIKADVAAAKAATTAS
jgi:YD repeat-containing protein